MIDKEREKNMKKTTAKKRMSIAAFERKYGCRFTRNHSAKMANLWSLSTSCKCNHNCQKHMELEGSICQKCFANAIQNQYSALEAKLRKNTEVLTTVLIEFEDVPYIKTKSGYFRFEAFGDLVNEIQVANYFTIASANPHLHCALWTKNPWIIKSAIKKYGLKKPENLTIIGSSYFINVLMTYPGYDFIDKVFTVYDEKYISENDVVINCGAKSCATCGLCYENKGGRYISEKLK